MKSRLALCITALILFVAVPVTWAIVLKERKCEATRQFVKDVLARGGEIDVKLNEGLHPTFEEWDGDRGRHYKNHNVSWRISDVSFVSISGESIDDAWIQNLANHKRINSLRLTKTSITDRGLKSLASLTNLCDLRLEQAAISDDGLTALESMPRLSTLWLTVIALRIAAWKPSPIAKPLKHWF